MKIWILNHYATDMYFDEGGRHHAFAKYLIRMGHNVKIFCANTVHNSDVIVNLQGNQYIEKTGADHVPYVFVKARPYQGNGKNRILNMVDYFKNVKYVLNAYKNREGIPDIILASSVHPLTLVAGIKWAHKNSIKCICEIRDLWPLSIVEYSRITDKNPVIKCMYILEHWIYTNADALIFSFSGGKQYILDKKWEKTVDLNKVFYVNTGIDLEKYRCNEENSNYRDDDLANKNTFKIIYAGAIREVNSIDIIVEAANMIKEKYSQVKFFIYGDGDQKAYLEEKCIKNNINNIVFKGAVAKSNIPCIINKADLLLINLKANNLWKYGVSWNKMFEYMAAGRPMVSNCPAGIIAENNLGVAKKFETVNEYVEAINYFIEMDDDEYNQICSNCKNIVKGYDCAILTEKIINIVRFCYHEERISRDEK